MINRERNKNLFSKELNDALAQYIPVFGNQEDIHISQQITKLHEQLLSIDIDAFRLELSKPKNRKLTPKMVGIERNEKSLTRWIIKRNLDF